MNIKIAIISTIAIAAATVSIQPANAQQRPSQRFDYAPNVWRMEEVRKPRGFGIVENQPQHAVRHGNVSPGRQLIGIDPAMLRRPTPRVAPAATQVAANPLGSFTNMIPKLSNPFTPVANKGQFGAPLSVNTPPVVATLPPAAQPQRANAQPLPQGSSANAVSGRLSAPRSTSSLHGRLAKPKRAVGLAARPAAPIQSYGSMGYKQGTFIPASSGYGMSSATSVSGKVLRH